jgi:hypothetical protein
MTPQHRHTPFVALVASVSVSLWLVISAGMRTATAAADPIRIPQASTSATIETSPGVPTPTAGPDLSIKMR